MRTCNENLSYAAPPAADDLRTNRPGSSEPPTSDGWVGTTQDGFDDSELPGIEVAEMNTREATVVTRVLDSAAEYIAINTNNPKIPTQLSLSLKVHILRSLRGMTQHQLADACGVNQSYVSMIEKETGKVPEDAVRRVKEYLALADADADVEKPPSRARRQDAQLPKRR